MLGVWGDFAFARETSISAGFMIKWRAHADVQFSLEGRKTRVPERAERQCQLTRELISARST